MKFKSKLTEGLIIIAVSTLGMGATTPASAQAAIGPIAADATINSVLDNLRNNLITVIAAAQSATSAGSFRIATDAQLLLQNFEILAKGLEGKVFKDLNESQQNTINNLAAAVADAQSDLANNIEKLDMAIKGAGMEISRFPGVSKRPFLSKVRPAFVVRAGDTFDVEIAGSLLNAKDARLTIGGVNCQLRSNTELIARFACGISALSNSNPNSNWVDGDLTLIKVGFFKLKTPYRYKVALRTIAPELGTYELNYTQLVTGTSTVDRSATNSHQKGHCEGPNDVRWTYVPSASCKVDVKSVSVSEGHSSQSSYGGVDSLSPKGFQVYGTVRNNGSCGPKIFGSYTFLDGRGSLGVTATWKDICPTEKEVVAIPEIGKLYWGVAKSFTLPADVQSFTIKVTQANGTQQILTNSVSDGNWYKAAYDPNTRIFVIRPRDIESALANEGLTR